MGDGLIYTSTWWGDGVCDNTVEWGSVYKSIAGCSPTPFFEVLAENGDFLLTEQDINITLEIEI